MKGKRINAHALRALALLGWFGTFLAAQAAPLRAEESQALLVLRSDLAGDTRLFFEYRYLPTQNNKRGGDRVDLQRLGVRTDFRSVTGNAVILIRDADSSLVKAWEVIPSLTLSKKGLQPALEATGYLVNSRFVGPWDHTLRADMVSEGRLGVRFANGQTQWLAKASPVLAPASGPFAEGGFASSKTYELGKAAPAACARVQLHFDSTGRLRMLHCVP